MGRSHHGIALSFQSPLTRTRLLAVIVMFCIACGLILLTPYRLHAEEINYQASTPASPTVAGSAQTDEPAQSNISKSTWSKTSSASAPASDRNSESGRASKGFLYVLGILLLAFALYKKFSGKRGAHALVDIEVLARKAVSPKHALLIVTVEGERLLLAQGTETLSFVTKLSTSSSFRSELAQFLDPETEKGFEELDFRENIHSGSDSLKRAGNS